MRILRCKIDKVMEERNLKNRDLVGMIFDYEYANGLIPEGTALHSRLRTIDSMVSKVKNGSHKIPKKELLSLLTYVLEIDRVEELFEFVEVENE